MEQQRWGMAPQIQWEQMQREREEQKKKEESRKRFLEKQKEESRRLRKVKIETMISIFMVAGTVGMLLFRMSGIYMIQKDFNALVTETRVMHKENEDLRAKIMTYENISVLSQRATELPLVPVGDENTLSVNLSKNNFREDTVTTSNHWADKVEEKVMEWYEKLL